EAIKLNPVDLSKAVPDPLAFLRDPAVHSEIALSLLGGLKSSVCLLAICHALITHEKLESWLARAILERWVDAQRGFLRLPASDRLESTSRSRTARAPRRVALDRDLWHRNGPRRSNRHHRATVHS